MIYGIGIDIVDVRRMRASYARFGDRLAQKILTPGELEDFQHTRNPVRFLAMRFAAKEATSKALGTGFKQGVSPRKIGVKHNRAGKPSLSFHGTVARRIRQHRIIAGSVSLTDEVDYALAYVVLETQARERDPRKRFTRSTGPGR